MRIRLLAVTEEVRDALGSREAMLAQFGAEAGRSVGVVRKGVRQTLEYCSRIGAAAPWIGYLAVDEDTRTIVGLCGFKGGPDGDGRVEIAYMTLREFEGRGVATGAAAALVAIAREGPGVRRAIAHTLPERNASCRVLEKCGFALEGEVEDPEDGRVWRWGREA